MPYIQQIDDGLHCIDLNFQGRDGVVAAYLLQHDGERALIETGPTSTLENLLAGLRSVNVEPDSIDKLLVTHVHLDHAGASGTFMARFPRAQLFVHEVGAPHMIDPSRLLASATRIYGDMMGSLWGPVDPVPEERVTALHDDDTIAVGSRRLTVLYTPGHASHHVAYYDATRASVFAGDAAAVRLQQVDIIRLPTPPPDIDLELWLASLDRIAALSPAAVYLGHFGRFTDVQSHIERTRERLSSWAGLIRRELEAGQDRETIVDTANLVAERELLEVTNDARVLARFDLAAPNGMSVDGMLRYFRKKTG